mgnify:CR=1 FL=1
MRLDRINSFLAFVFMALLLVTKTAFAEDAVILQQDVRQAGLVNVVGPQGFITQLQVVDADTLSEQVQVLRSQLILRKQQLVREVGEKQLDSGDALLTVLMPGGLLYAGYKKAVYESARSDLADVSEEITEYSHDLSALAGQISVTVALQ